MEEGGRERSAGVGTVGFEDQLMLLQSGLLLMYQVNLAMPKLLLKLAKKIDFPNFGKPYA